MPMLHRSEAAYGNLSPIHPFRRRAAGDGRAVSMPHDCGMTESVQLKLCRHRVDRVAVQVASSDKDWHGTDER